MNARSIYEKEKKMYIKRRKEKFNFVDNVIDNFFPFIQEIYKYVYYYIYSHCDSFKNRYLYISEI